MKVAVLGGSFNPPHICHLFICHYVLATSDADQVWIIPCYKHAFGKDLVSFDHRFAMCCLAVEPFQDELVRVLPIEKERQGTSWTIDTMRYLKVNYPEIDFTWIIGSDVLDELNKWKDFDQLQHLITFIVVPRASSAAIVSDRRQNVDFHNIRKNIEILKELRQQADHLDTQGFQLPNISSTLIRERVKHHIPIHHLVPRKVEEYIYAHQLYL